MTNSQSGEWPIQHLDSLATSIDYGHTASANISPVGPKFLRITDIRDDHVDWSTVPFCECDSESLDKLTLQPGDIVFARTGSTGKNFLIRDCPGRAIFASYLIRVRPNKTVVNPQYLARFFQTPSYWSQISKTSVGTIQSGVNASKLRDLLVPVPPMDEQKRIATLLNKADAIRRKRQEAIALTEQLLHSTFLEMFGDPVTNPKRWPTVKLSSLILEGPTNGLYRPASDYGDGTPIVRIDSFYDGEISDLASLKRVRIPADVIEKFGLSPGQILVNRVNSPEHLGKAALVPRITEPTVFESNMMRMSINEEQACPEFLVSQLGSRYIKIQIERARKDASNQSSINQEDVRGFEIRLPPIATQRRYRDILTAIRTHSIKSERMLAEAESLFNSLVQRAFSGQL